MAALSKKHSSNALRETSANSALTEVASLLALALLRLRAKRQVFQEVVSDVLPLDLPNGESVHAAALEEGE
jgi:hypothetical protein